jgi:mannose-6-phosphate isomerase-like protein (cupin superfamily)
MWWINKTVGGVYAPPMRPLWKQAELLRMHAGQNNWREQVVLDPEQDATYNSAEPGSHVSPRMHLDTHVLFVVLAGEVHFTVEGQLPVTATRGSIVNILKSTIYSYEIAGTVNALWVEVHRPNYKTQYPASGPAPAPLGAGQVIKVSILRTPAQYAPPNQLHWNVFSDGIDKCQQRPNSGYDGMRVLEDGHFANPLLSYVNPVDNKCQNGPTAPRSGRTPFDIHGTFGHLHQGPAEWWIVLAGSHSAKFENLGEFHAVEGDVLYAAPNMWHQMAGDAPSGPSIRLAMGGYQIIGAVAEGVVR